MHKSNSDACSKKKNFLNYLQLTRGLQTHKFKIAEIYHFLSNDIKTRYPICGTFSSPEFFPPDELCAMLSGLSLEALTSSITFVVPVLVEASENIFNPLCCRWIFPYSKKSFGFVYIAPKKTSSIHAIIRNGVNKDGFLFFLAKYRRE
mmetsp:Transcript_3515/g.5080  ORF Transcript_3515/g.5080 Transcript_3515/m.5080 type:complete len:148 (-) Transcript_3515:51-494(-)